MRKLGLILMAFGVVACTSTTATGGTEYEVYEASIDGSTRLTTDDHNLRITNTGELTHTFVVTDSAGEVVAASDVIPSGTVTDLSVDLEAGTYSFTCRIVSETDEGELIDHFELGMNLTVEVTS